MNGERRCMESNWKMPFGPVEIEALTNVVADGVLLPDRRLLMLAMITLQPSHPFYELVSCIPQPLWGKIAAHVADQRVMVLDCLIAATVGNQLLPLEPEKGHDMGEVD